MIVSVVGTLENRHSHLFHLIISHQRHIAVVHVRAGMSISSFRKSPVHMNAKGAAGQLQFKLRRFFSRALSLTFLLKSNFLLKHTLSL